MSHQKVSDFASKINDIFGLQEQGRELITVVTRAVGSKHACLLFLDSSGEDFTKISSFLHEPGGHLLDNLFVGQLVNHNSIGL